MKNQYVILETPCFPNSFKAEMVRYWIESMGTYQTCNQFLNCPELFHPTIEEAEKYIQEKGERVFTIPLGCGKFEWPLVK